MNPIDRYDNFYLVGIGGAGMYALATLLLEAGKYIAGSDIQKSYKTEKLEKRGVKISYTQDSLPTDTRPDCVIFTAAVTDGNREIEQAVDRFIPVYKYSQFIGEISKNYATIAVSGTHGKTTTAALLSYMLEKGGLDPCYIVGEEIINNHRSSRFGRGRHFVVESCEFGRSFHDLQPTHAIVTNIEEEHPDTYGSISEIRKSFETFLSKCSARDSRIFINADDGNCSELISANHLPYVTASMRPPLSSSSSPGRKGAADWAVTSSNGQFTVYNKQVRVGDFTRLIKGSHNLSNILLAVSCANYLGVKTEAIREAVAEFAGVRRRMEIVKSAGNLIVIDDYAHHPTQIRAVLKTARELNQNAKIIAVFQPHQYCRTERFFNEYSLSFKESDLVIVTPIYAARDTKRDPTLAEKITQAIGQNSAKAVLAKGLDEAKEIIDRDLSGETLVITLGAGDVCKLAHDL